MPWFQLLSSQLPQHFFDKFWDLAFPVLHSRNAGLSLLVLLEVRRQYISKYGAHKRKEIPWREFLGVNRLGINVQHENSDGLSALFFVIVFLNPNSLETYLLTRLRVKMTFNNGAMRHNRARKSYFSQIMELSSWPCYLLTRIPSHLSVSFPSFTVLALLGFIS